MDLVMYSSIIAGVILVLVGIIKLPLKKFKGRKFYRAGFTLLTIVLVLAACVLFRVYILHEALIALPTLYLILMAFGETMLTYNGVYEGFGIKGLARNLILKFVAFCKRSPEDKLVKQAEKLGIAQAVESLYIIGLSKGIFEEEVQGVVKEDPKEEQKVEENATIIEENVSQVPQETVPQEQDVKVESTPSALYHYTPENGGQE